MTAFPNIDVIERFEKAVRANGYRTRDAATDTEYQAAKAAILAEARKADAMKREIAELREALEMISAESKADNAPIGRSVFKALATCGEIADIAISTRTADRAEQDGSATSSSGTGGGDA